MGHLSSNDRCETECTGRRVSGKHDDLQEIAYETFGLASPAAGRRDSCRMLVTNKVSGQMGVWEHMWLRLDD